MKRAYCPGVKHRGFFLATPGILFIATGKDKTLIRKSEG
jgi:hypothetical protein